LDFLYDLIEVLAIKIREHPVEFEKKFDSNLGSFHVDTTALRSALINVLENAFDACLLDSSKKKHKIVFKVRQMPDHISFDIEDNGIGMDTKTKANAFSLFFSTKGTRGTGLGLFIANDVIRKHNGTIDIDSVKCRGSHVCITVPNVHVVRRT